LGSYFVIVTCRNSETNIRQALLALKNQSLKARYVIVIDDGSTDRTSAILDEMRAEWDILHIITNADLGYNIARVVSNWNRAIKYAKETRLEETDYHMISTDDTVYEEHYAEKLISYMDGDPSIAVSSGDYGEGGAKTPHGAGRMVRNSFFFQVYGLYPEKMGYESVVLYAAILHKYTYRVFSDARFEHLRALGTNHHFYEFGASMRNLGYHPFFVLGRFCVYFVSGKPIGRIGALYMLYHYLLFRPEKDGYNSPHDYYIRNFIRRYQWHHLKSLLKP